MASRLGGRPVKSNDARRIKDAFEAGVAGDIPFSRSDVDINPSISFCPQAELSPVGQS